MLLRFIWVGKTRNDALRELVNDYLQRVSRFGRYEVTEVRESEARNTKEGIEDEGRRIISALRGGAATTLLDLSGIEWTSHELSDQIRKWRDSGTREVAFVIGGHNGVSEPVKKRCDLCWSLSRMTFTHEMARVLVVEQIYRAFTIIKGLPYQK